MVERRRRAWLVACAGSSLAVVSLIACASNKGSPTVITEHDSAPPVVDSTPPLDDTTVVDDSAAPVDDSAPPPIDDSASDTRVDAIGDTAPSPPVSVSGPDGTKVDVPSGALAVPTTISIEKASTGYPSFPSTFAPFGGVYAFLPHGTTFTKPVTVTIPFTGTAPDGLALYTAQPSGAWSSVSSAKLVGSSMVATVDHFSFFTLGGAPSVWKDVTGIIPVTTAVPEKFVPFGTQIFAAHVTGAFRSLDDADTWIAVNSGLPSGYAVHDFVAHGSYLFAATSYGVVRCTPSSGVTWGAVNAGLPLYTSTADAGKVVQIQRLGVTRSGRLLASISGYHLYTGGRVFASDDDGLSWHDVSTGMPPPDAAGADVWSFADNGSGTVYAGTFEQGLFSSTDNGTSWTRISGVRIDERVRALTVVSDHTTFAGTTWSGLLKSGSWGRVDDAVMAGAFNEIGAITSIGARLFANLDYQSVQLSDDDGTTWKTYRAGLANTYGRYPNISTMGTNGRVLVIAGFEPASATEHVWKAVVPP